MQNILFLLPAYFNGIDKTKQTNKNYQFVINIECINSVSN